MLLLHNFPPPPLPLLLIAFLIFLPLFLYWTDPYHSPCTPKAPVLRDGVGMKLPVIIWDLLAVVNFHWSTWAYLCNSATMGWNWEGGWYTSIAFRNWYSESGSTIPHGNVLRCQYIPNWHVFHICYFRESLQSLETQHTWGLFPTASSLFHRFKSVPATPWPSTPLWTTFILFLLDTILARCQRRGFTC